MALVTASMNVSEIEPALDRCSPPACFVAGSDHVPGVIGHAGACARDLSRMPARAKVDPDATRARASLLHPHPGKEIVDDAREARRPGNESFADPSGVSRRFESDRDAEQGKALELPGVAA